ncbi:alpha/beta fold hydrolase [Bowmanella dokdonensis]|uniref:Alpha/beta fold hydrolase n=1 Tax=Bowmanella dokdonensis TaxID=751969 RepID=A0A939DTM5_9ALTE|nr:alpha/beta fold hydrolase [Bowmanella dokdonensis]MBN7827681.1 alpha/beta fold hydrolase [Bowmanella dokdonensis]
MRKSSLLALASLLLSTFVHAVPDVQEGEFIIKNFAFETGGELDLRQHYRTLGEIKRDENGQVTNAVLVMHGTTGSGAGFLRDQYAGVLFAKGGLLDAEKYFIILPDAIGHGQSSKPSDGLGGAFPTYTYDDMVRAQYRLLTEHLKVNHLRLVTGTSMGGMFSWVWGYTYPDYMDALMPLASLPVEIAGRNRVLRKMIIDAVKNDPQWQQGSYTTQPPGLREAMYPLIMMVSSPLQYQLQAPTREQAETMLDSLVERYAGAMDANDLIWAFDASRFYNPKPHLEQIKAPVLAINSADDQVNPPELGILEQETKRVKQGTAVTLPITQLTRGHGTHSIPSIWGPYLARLLAATAEQASPDLALLTTPQSPLWSQAVPDVFTARFETTEGAFEITVHKAWAPLGAARFYHLVKNGFYDGVSINRVVEGFIAQFGLSPSPQVTKAWANQAIADDPVVASNQRGRVAFAMTGPDTRNTQVYISLNDNSRLDKDGFAPFGEVTQGMEVVDRLYSLYGETAGGGMRGGKQGPIKEQGNAYLSEHYPLLDFIVDAYIVGE